MKVRVWIRIAVVFGILLAGCLAVGSILLYKNNEDRKITEGQNMIAELTNMPVAYVHKAALEHTEQKCYVFTSNGLYYYVSMDQGYIAYVFCEDTAAFSDGAEADTDEIRKQTYEFLAEILPRDVAGEPLLMVLHPGVEGFFVRACYLVDQVGTGTDVYLTYSEQGVFLSAKIYYTPCSSFPLPDSFLTEEEALKKVIYLMKKEKREVVNREGLYKEIWGYRSYITFEGKESYWNFLLPVSEGIQTDFNSLLVKIHAETGELINIEKTEDSNVLPES